MELDLATSYLQHTTRAAIPPYAIPEYRQRLSCRYPTPAILHSKRKPCIIRGLDSACVYITPQRAIAKRRVIILPLPLGFGGRSVLCALCVICFVNAYNSHTITQNIPLVSLCARKETTRTHTALLIPPPPPPLSPHSPIEAPRYIMIFVLPEACCRYFRLLFSHHSY